MSFEPSAKYHATDKANFTSDAEFNDLMNLKNVQSTGPVSKLKSSKKSTMVFPVCSHPPRTRSVIKDTVPKSSIPKGKRKIQDFVDDPDYEIEEPSSPNEPVGASRSTKKQKYAASSKPTASATKPQKHSTRPLTRGVTDKSPDTTAAKSSKATSANVRYVSKSALSSTFFCDKNRKNWDAMSKRSILGERVLNKSSDSIAITKLLEKMDLMTTVTKPKPFVAAVVYEFYANLSANISIFGSPQYHKVYVRGHIFGFSEDVINEYFGIKLPELNFLDPPPSDDELNMDKVATELMGHPTVWEPGKRLPSSQLTSKYTMLTKVGLCNWFPMMHSSTIDSEIGCFLYRLGKGMELNLGDYIFRQIVSQADHISSRTYLVFPSLIFEILRLQHRIHKSGEPFTPLKYFKIVQTKLLRGNRVVDIEGETTADVTGPKAKPANSETHASASHAHRDLATQIQDLATSNARITALLDKILIQQDAILQNQADFSDLFSGFVGSRSSQ